MVGALGNSSASATVVALGSVDWGWLGVSRARTASWCAPSHPVRRRTAGSRADFGQTQTAGSRSSWTNLPGAATATAYPGPQTMIVDLYASERTWRANLRGIDLSSDKDALGISGWFQAEPADESRHLTGGTRPVSVADV